MQIHEVFLKRGLEPLVKYDFPEGFTIRSYHHGDEENWLNIYMSTDQLNKAYSTMFREYFGADQSLLVDRQFYLSDPDGKPVGTASAWYNRTYHGKEWGRLHWVAIVPEMQGRGLAKPLISHALERLQDLGHKQTYLRTYTVRIVAIKIYWDLGFVPDLRSQHDKDVWLEFAKENNMLDIEQYVENFSL